MQEALSVLGIAVVAFVSTNIDDLLVVSAFFADPSLDRRAVVVGQFMGIAALTAVSAAAAVMALAVPAEWTALLGLAPLSLGIAKLVALRDPQEGIEPGLEADAAAHGYENRIHVQWLSVAAVTVANGGDNLGVYIPLFASSPWTVPVYAGVFAVMTAIWCLCGYLLVSSPVGATVASRWGRVVLPFVLIGIGLRILWGAQALFAHV